jgi:hypothetical protein
VAFTFSRHHLILPTPAVLHAARAASVSPNFRKMLSSGLMRISGSLMQYVHGAQQLPMLCGFHRNQNRAIHHFVTHPCGIESLLMRFCASSMHHCGVHLLYIKSEPTHGTFPSHPLCHEVPRHRGAWGPKLIILPEMHPDDISPILS